jgi:hypothetical protein
MFDIIIIIIFFQHIPLEILFHQSLSNDIYQLIVQRFSFVFFSSPTHVICIVFFSSISFEIKTKQNKKKRM